MATIIRHICDVCEKEINRKDLSSVPVLIHVRDNDSNDTGIDCVQVDICRDCLNKYLALTWRYLAEFSKYPDGKIVLKENLSEKGLPENIHKDINQEISKYIEAKIHNYIDAQMQHDFNSRWENKYTSKKTTLDRNNVFVDGVYAFKRYLLDEDK